MRKILAVASVAALLGACTGNANEKSDSLASSSTGVPQSGAASPAASATAAASPDAVAEAAPAPGNPAVGAAGEAAAPGATPAAGEAVADAGGLSPPAPGGAAVLAASKITLPSGWAGKGVLAKRAEKLPKRAPAWGKANAEVIEEDGKRLLLATGYVTKIKDAYLSRSTAESRARTELARWTGSAKVSNSIIRDYWRDPKSGDTLVRAALVVPATWVPGMAVEAP